MKRKQYFTLSLKSRVLRLFLFQGTLLILIIFIFGRLLTVQQLEMLAQESAKKSSLDVVSELNSEVESLKSTALDYSTDDELHKLMKDAQNSLDINPNLKTFMDSKLHSSTNITLKLSSIYILSNAGNIVYENDYDYLQRRETPSLTIKKKDTIKEYIMQPQFYKTIRTRDVLNGLLYLNEELVFMSAQPILTTNLNGPKNGILIMTRTLDTEKFNKKHPLTSFHVANTYTNKMEDVNNMFNNFLDVKIYTEHTNKKTHNYHTKIAIPTITNNQYVILEDYPTDSYLDESLSSVNLLFIMIIGSTMILFISIWYFMNRFVVNRIRQILTAISSVTQTSSDDPSVETQSDELLLIEKQIDHILMQLRHYHTSLVKRSYNDPLTGLYNRLGFHDESQKILAESQKNHATFAILFIDIDRFKCINDTYGHLVGDLMIKEFSRRLVSSIPSSSLVARISGDEFVIILKDVDTHTQLEDQLQQLKATAENAYILDSHTFYTTSSMGISLYPQDGKTIDDLLNHADLAMYAVKHSTRNDYLFFNETMRKRITAQSIQHGLDNNEFYLMFQPQYDLHTNTLLGMEILVRWDHPIYNNVPPNEFIPIAEESDLIIDLTEWIITEAFTQVKQWNTQYPATYKVSINLSTLHLRNHERLYDFIIFQLHKYQLSGSQFVFEITESFSVGSDERIVDTLKDLNALGFEISIDDFGKEYSVLNYLHKLPITGLKIDRSFINEMNENDKIVRMIIALANTMDLKVVAEGIETNSQQQQLKNIGCKIGQGYLYSPPILPLDIEEQFLSPKIKALP